MESFGKKYEIEKINGQLEPQPMAPAPIQTPTEPAPTIHEHVAPIPSVKPIPRKDKPPVPKKDVPIKPKEIIPEKRDKPIETAPIEATPIQPKETLASVLIKKYSELPPNNRSHS